MSSVQVKQTSSSRSSHGRDQKRRNQAAVVKHAGHMVPPLQWWRNLPALAYTAEHLKVLRKAIAGFDIIGEPHWSAAATGDPAAAVGVALRAIKRCRKPTPTFDLLMSALLRCAITGDDAAIHTLAHVLRQMAANDSSCAQVARSWQSTTSASPHHQLVRGG